MCSFHVINFNVFFFFLISSSFHLSGVNFITRKIGNSISPTIYLTKEGDEFKLHTESTFKNTIVTFKLGEEFDEETIDGRKVKSVCTLDGDTLTQEQKGDKPSTIVRKFTADGVVATMSIGDITCEREYVAI